MHELTYAFFLRNELSITVKGVFAAAFMRWAEVMSLNFCESASYFSANIRIGFFNGDHNDGELFDVSLGTLACAFSLMNRRFFSGGRDWALISGRSGYLSDDFFTKEEGSVGKG
ncbi:hypothetical protein GYH30_031377 [Glycine max]|nr:hypothetical protein GYH30_031377 [Glycine max]